LRFFVLRLGVHMLHTHKYINIHIHVKPLHGELSKCRRTFLYSIHILLSLSRTLQNFCLLACTYSSRDSICSPTCVCVRARACVHVLEPRKPLLANLNLYLSIYLIMSVCLSVYFSIHPCTCSCKRRRS
jgi:hypothetical protein